MITSGNVEIVNGQWMSGTLSTPTVIVEQADTLASVGQDVVVKVEGGTVMMSCQNFGNIQPHAVPMGRQRLAEPLGTGKAVGTDEPGLWSVGQAMYGRAVLYVIESDTLVRSSTDEGDRVVCAEYQYHTHKCVGIGGNT